MWILIGAVVTASVLGSMHCVGMCGPLAMWASGAADGSSRLAIHTSLYHLGRLITYACVGLIAGLIGQLTDLGGEVLGVQLAAARIVGVLMVLIGLMQIVRWSETRIPWIGRLIGRRTNTSRSNLTASKPSGISGWLVTLRPRVFALSVLSARSSQDC